MQSVHWRQVVKVNGKEMAQALGLSESMVSKLRKRGMPMSSSEAAERWRRRHLEPARMKGSRSDVLPAKCATSRLRRANEDRADALTESLRRLVAPYSVNAALPEAIVLAARDDLRRMAFGEFRRLYDDVRLADVVWRLAPESLREWDNWTPEGVDDDWYEPIPELDLALLHLVIGGAAEFEFDASAAAAAGARPAFRDCIRLSAEESR